MAKTKTTTINWPLFSQMLKATRARRGHTLRDVEALTTVSASEICRIELGAVTTHAEIGTFFSLCVYMELKPERFCQERPVPRFSRNWGIEGALYAINNDKALTHTNRLALVCFLRQAYDLCAALPG